MNYILLLSLVFAVSSNVVNTKNSRKCNTKDKDISQDIESKEKQSKAVESSNGDSDDTISASDITSSNKEMCQRMITSSCYHGGNMKNKEKEGVYPSCWAKKPQMPSQWNCYLGQENGRCHPNQIDIRTTCNSGQVYKGFYWYHGKSYDGVDFTPKRKYIPAGSKGQYNRGAVYKLTASKK